MASIDIKITNSGDTRNAYSVPLAQRGAGSYYMAQGDTVHLNIPDAVLQAWLNMLPEAWLKESAYNAPSLIKNTIRARFTFETSTDIYQHILEDGIAGKNCLIMMPGNSHPFIPVSAEMQGNSVICTRNIPGETLVPRAQSIELLILEYHDLAAVQESLPCRIIAPPKDKRRKLDLGG